MTSSISERAAAPSLVRGIRKWDLLALVINSVVGGGIFGLPARAYALAGVYSLIAYVVCAIAIFLITLCFAEVASRFEDTGGPYLYARSTFGSVVGFEVGWLSWIVRLTAFAALCNLFADYLIFFVPTSGTAMGRVIVSTLVVAVLAIANFAGVRFASVAGNILVVGKLVPLGLLILAGLFFIRPENYAVAAVPSLQGFSASALVLLFAFTGFEIAVIPAGESADPRRYLPRALLVGTLIVALLYVAIQAICIGTVPQLANSQKPLADVGQQIMGATGAAIISLVALISVTGTMNAIMLAAPRLLYAMAEQRQLPRFMATTHARFHTPHIAILVTAIGMLALTLTGTFAFAATLSTVIRLTTYAVTCAALPMLRRKTGKPAPFAVPAGTVVTVLSLLLIAWLFSSSSWLEIRLGLLAVVIGLVVFAISRPRTARTVS
jgi:amino acid transporter